LTPIQRNIARDIPQKTREKWIAGNHINVLIDDATEKKTKKPMQEKRVHKTGRGSRRKTKPVKLPKTLRIMTARASTDHETNAKIPEVDGKPRSWRLGRGLAW
jgi:hypothetical protein